MASPRRDLATRGRVAVAMLSVGAAGALAGWMALTDHAASNSTSSTGTSSTGATESPASDADRSVAVPGGAASSSNQVPDARTGGS